ncbi:hypothetical protein QBC43DRAFT_297781 [Cladorrhinum sp. PSN259]|nr:hypothetical protein QBC43DRAFT_297781 [Cladorrhinum sp. PSN259]
MTDVFYSTIIITIANVFGRLGSPNEEYAKFDRDLGTLADALRTGNTGSHAINSFVEGFYDSLVHFAMTIGVRRKLARTRNGYLCLVPRHTKVGDKLALFKGGALPLVIREPAQGWQMLGVSYVHGVMMREAYDEAKCQAFLFI